MFCSFGFRTGEIIEKKGGKPTSLPPTDMVCRKRGFCFKKEGEGGEENDSFSPETHLDLEGPIGVVVVERRRIGKKLTKYWDVFAVIFHFR